MKRKLSCLVGIAVGIALTVGFISLVAATPTEETSLIFQGDRKAGLPIFTAS